jgi:TonB-linked SusC/RagA family outer membrane protein
MQLIAFCKSRLLWLRRYKKTFLAMKILTILILAASIAASGKGIAQTFSFSVKKALLESVFKVVEAQSSFRFVYTREQIEHSSPVTLAVKDESLEKVLDLLFKDQPIHYSIESKYILIKSKEIITLIDITGRVTNESNEPVSGASIKVKNVTTGTTTNSEGVFILKNVDPGATLIISGAEIETQEVKVESRSTITIRIRTKVNELDRVLMIGYGQTTVKLNTGNVAKVGADIIGQQPVSNPLAALQGRVAGLLVTQTTGVPGAAISVEIRGRSSIDLSKSQNVPLFVIDGVPFEPGATPANQLTSAVNNPRQISQGGLSAFNAINPADIESIEILKDADATAIYGSRGANGVVLITTKSAVAGKTKVLVNFNTGWSRAVNTTDMLNTQQYIAMRREAFANDGLTPGTIAGASFAPDILLWDTTRYTNFKKLLTGNTAHSNDIQTSISGGDAFTQFLFGAAYHRETNVFSEDLSDVKYSAHIKVSHSSKNRKFKLALTASYGSDKNKLISTDLTNFINLPPNIDLIDSAGNLKWADKGVGYGSISHNNPLSVFLRKYVSQLQNLLSNLQLSYQLTNELQVKCSFGYNSFSTDETSITPKAAIDPAQTTILGNSRFGYRSSSSWILEPQLTFNKNTRFGRFSILYGNTFQRSGSKSTTLTGSNYINDLLLYSIAAAGTITAINESSEYKYTASFGRISYNLRNSYLVNLSLRRDGSSRFGPDRKFANFFSLGTGWIFSSDSNIHRALPFLSFGKLRASYGITGNDQIGDYKYFDLWNNSINPYQNIPGLVPGGLFNPDYNWERNRKLEFGLELGALKDRLLFSASYYRNRSGNQLVNYTLPSQTGFTTVTLNWPALVQNSGLEFTLNGTIISSKLFKWTTALNLSIPKNKLVSFPGLLSSSYANTYVPGQSLSLIKRYEYGGVDPATGLYIIVDQNKDGQINTAFDEKVLGQINPRFYGGVQNSFTLQQLRLDLFFEIRKQTGLSYLSTQSTYRPGTLYNQPVTVLNRWQLPGNISPVQKFTTSGTTLAGMAAGSLFTNSSAMYADASFIKLRNASLTYEFPVTLLKRLHFEYCSIYINAQNLFTITRYKGSDPETQNFQRLPPLRAIVAGIQLTF